MKARKILVLSLIALLAVIAVSCASPTTAPAPASSSSAPASSSAAAKFVCNDKIGCLDVAPNDPVHIAYIMVVLGEDGTLGQDTRNGAEIAVDDKGGKVLGHAVKFDGQDDGCGAEGGQTAATKVAADSTVIAVIGTNCSSAGRAAIPIISKAGLTMISPSATAVALTDSTKHDAAFLRTAHSDFYQSWAAAQFMSKQLKVKSLAAVHDGSLYSEGLATAAADAFKQLGGTVTSVEAVAPTDKDMKPVLTRLAAGKPEMLYMPAFIGASGAMCAQIRDVPGLEKTIMMGADGVFSPDFLKACGKNALGMYWSSPDLSALSSGYDTMKAAYIKKYNVKAPLSVFHAHSYDAMNIILSALEKSAVKDADGTLHIGRQALRDAIYATKDFKGLTGNLTCNKDGDCADPKMGIYQSTADNITNLVMPSKPIWTPSGTYWKP